MKRRFNASLWLEDGWYIAQCLEVDVASQGASPDQALENLAKALQLHFTPPVATIAPEVRAIEIDVDAA